MHIMNNIFAWLLSVYFLVTSVVYPYQYVSDFMTYTFLTNLFPDVVCLLGFQSSNRILNYCGLNIKPTFRRYEV